MFYKIFFKISATTQHAGGKSMGETGDNIEFNPRNYILIYIDCKAGVGGAVCCAT